MDSNGSPVLQDVVDNLNQARTRSSYGPSRGLARPLSVDEALQYSPMSSSPIFGLDCVLRPDIGRPSNTTSINHILQAGRSVLTDLNSEMESNHDSSRLDASRKYLQQLLDDDGLTEFKFKATDDIASILLPNPAVYGTPSPSHSDLGSFSRMVLDSTNVAFRYSNVPAHRQEDNSKKPLQATFHNKQAYDASRTNPASHVTKTYGAEQLSTVIAMKPEPHDSYDRNIPKRRKLSTDGINLSAQRFKDRKEEAEAALSSLQDTLHEIFEAEDQLEPGIPPGTGAGQEHDLFTAAKAFEVSGFLLSADAQSRLQKALRKVLEFGRLGDIPSDYLGRIYKLCEKPILAAQTADLKLSDPPNEPETKTWLDKSDDILNALLAIGTLILTMSQRKTERDLCPEDLMDAVPVVLNQIFDHCIISAVEARPTGKEVNYFKFYSGQKRIIGDLIHQSKKVLSLLGDFLSGVDVSEAMINSTEFLAAKLIFVENAHVDKDSAIGYQKYEAIRRGGMDILAKIFSKYPDQRPFILNEILVSLEKLPSTRQNARQFKLIEGKNIQLFTALVMQLVQTTSLDTLTTGTKRKPSGTANRCGGEDSMDDSDNDENLNVSFSRLAQNVNRLYDDTTRSAQYIVRFVVERATTSTKSGDEPYRNILDLFTEDLTIVLGSADWPAAELLLRVLASCLIAIADHDKSPATAKSMALELLGYMGSAISDLTVSAQHLLHMVEESEDDLTDYLAQLFDDYSNRSLHLQDIIIPAGPYRITLEYLLESRSLDKWQLSSARGYYLLQWAKAACSIHYLSEGGGDVTQGGSADELAAILTKLFYDPLWLEAHRVYADIPASHGKLSYLLTVLSSDFCKAFDAILKVLLSSIVSDQATVRSRSLRSVIYILEKNPSLLDKDPTVMRVILRCATDASPMVRDSALSLIGKCIVLKPQLEEEGCQSILTRAADTAAGVRKRCIGLLKDIYVRTNRNELKLAILDSFLQRTADLEDAVAALARQTIEEIWLTPFYEPVDSPNDGPKLKVALEAQMAVIVDVVRRSESASEALGACLKRILSDNSMSLSRNFEVCKGMVSVLFEKLVEDTEPGKDHQQALLWTIAVFAKANAKLLRPDQLKTLQPYIGEPYSDDDVLILRPAVVIFRCVLPYVSSAHSTLLKEVQSELFRLVSKLARSELNEVMSCLWTINGVLKNTDRLVKMTASVLRPIQQYTNLDFSSIDNEGELNKAKRYIRIAGCIGRHCDLEAYESYFKRMLSTWNGGSVTGLMVDSIIPFTFPRQPLELRIVALESFGSICQSWPGQFGREESRQVISMVFADDNPSLQNIVLRSFAAFFAMHEGKAERTVQPSADTVDQETPTRLGGSMKASDHDGAAALIAQYFLKDMLQVAQTRQDTYALTAIELIASINRQGLVHPKECASVLISLETSTVPLIAKVAFNTHKMIHQQHESTLEREYMRAVDEAFSYQLRMLNSPSGAIGRPYASKLAPLFEVIKISNSRYQKKFLSNLCSKVDFELDKLDVAEDPPKHLLLAQFISQNLAFFDYGQLTELVPTIGCMERIVAATGTTVVHAIETDLFSMRVEAGENSANISTANDSVSLTSPKLSSSGNLRLLAVAAAALSMLWETRTYLHRLYGVTNVRQKEGKGASKELSKSANKIPGVSGDKYIEAIIRNMASLDSEESMVNKCREFATLLAVDDELKVSERGYYEDDTLVGPCGSDNLDATGMQRRKKRRSSVSGASIPKKRKAKKSDVVKKKGSLEPDNVE